MTFLFRQNAGELFRVVANDHRGNVVALIDNIATRDIAELVAELLTAAATGTKQLGLLVAD